MGKRGRKKATFLYLLYCEGAVAPTGGNYLESLSLLRPFWYQALAAGDSGQCRYSLLWTVNQLVGC